MSKKLTPERIEERKRDMDFLKNEMTMPIRKLNLIQQRMGHSMPGHANKLARIISKLEEFQKTPAPDYTDTPETSDYTHPRETSPRR